MHGSLLLVFVTMFHWLARLGQVHAPR
jgi:hypothetical protein